MSAEQLPRKEPVSIAERVRRDPRGLARVTLLGPNSEMVLFPVTEVPQEVAAQEIEEGGEVNG